MGSWDSCFHRAAGIPTLVFVGVTRICLTLCELLANVIFLQHIRKYLPELLSLVSELWSSFTLPAPVRPSRGLPVSCVLPRKQYVSYWL